MVALSADVAPPVRPRQSSSERSLSVASAERAEYLSEMPIRIILLAVALSACAQDLATSETETSEPLLACDIYRYACHPNSPGSDQICSNGCGYPSHCRDYSSGEYVWCEIHPGSCLGGFRCCDLRGNPTWDTRCVEGDRP